jgi:hypothetical protein
VTIWLGRTAFAVFDAAKATAAIPAIPPRPGTEPGLTRNEGLSV